MPETDEQIVKEWSEVYATTDGLATLLGVVRETITRFAKVEGMPKAERGKYHVKECFDWFLDRERGKSSKDAPADKKARMLVARQQELRYKIENAEKLNELLPADLVQNAINQMASTLANQLDGLGPRMAAELAQIDDPAIVQRKLFDECRSIRSAATAALATIAGDIDSERDTQPATEPERGTVGRREPDIATEQPGTGEVAHG